jgi:hypothetical protein
MRVVYLAPQTEVVTMRPEGVLAVSNPELNPPFNEREDW